MNQIANLFEVIIAAVLVAVAIAMARAGECYYCVNPHEASPTRRLFYFIISYHQPLINI